ncbi:hypothetical protein N665_0003s0006 [Sinapis alba]|nr:hypothetical protein N665_0003s0006 [Sinapis alba]
MNSASLSLLMFKLSRAREYSIDDVRRCLHAHPGSLSSKKRRYIYKQARLRELAKNPLRTLRRYKDEMYVCLIYGNKETHYIEEMKHLKISAKNHYTKGNFNYLYAILKLLAGDHVEGINRLHLHNWRNNTYDADKLWRQVKRSLRDIPIIKRRSYGINMMLIMPPRSCRLKELEKRCTKCLYYKEMEKFIQLINRG